MAFVNKLVTAFWFHSNLIEGQIWRGRQRPLPTSRLLLFPLGLAQIRISRRLFPLRLFSFLRPVDPKEERPNDGGSQIT